MQLAMRQHFLFLVLAINWLLNSYCHGEQKWLRHIAMAAKFLDDNKPKIHSKSKCCTVSNFIDLIQFHLICQILAKFSGVESKRTISEFRKRKRNFLCCVHLLRKAGERN